MITSFSHIVLSQPVTKRAFFQLFVPDSLLLFARPVPPLGPTVKPEEEEKETKRGPGAREATVSIAARCLTLNGSNTNIRIASVHQLVVNHNISYVLPPRETKMPGFMSRQLETTQRMAELAKIHTSRKRLAEVFHSLGLPKLETAGSLLGAFISRIAFEVPETDGCSLLDLWKQYEDACAFGVDVFSKCALPRPVLAAYAPSLSGLHLVFQQSVGTPATATKELLFAESDPPHYRCPLLNKIVEMGIKNRELHTACISAISQDSWYHPCLRHKIGYRCCGRR